MKNSMKVKKIKEEDSFKTQTSSSSERIMEIDDQQVFDASHALLSLKDQKRDEGSAIEERQDNLNDSTTSSLSDSFQFSPNP